MRALRRAEPEEKEEAMNEREELQAAVSARYAAATTCTNSLSSAGSVTLEKITRAIASLPRAPRHPGPDALDSLFAPFGSFGGVRIIEVPSDIRPVLQVRDDVPCTDETRREVNAWLLDKFGTRDHSPFARGTALMFGAHTALLRKEDAALLHGLSSS
jgi:hypothetical protein